MPRVSTEACSVDGCNRPRLARGLCTRHYQKWRKYGDPLASAPKVIRRCEVDGCDEKHFGLGYCGHHYRTWRTYGTPTPRPKPTPGEQWRLIPGTDGAYSASTLGRIRREKRGHHARVGRVLKGYINEDGYVKVRVYPRPDRRVVSAHQLVAETFLGPCPPGHEVNHKNGDKQDNRPENLEYVTHVENIHHAWHVSRHARRFIRRGPKANTAKFTADEVRSIRKRHANGETYQALADEFGVAKRTIYVMVKRRTYRNVL